MGRKYTWSVHEVHPKYTSSELFLHLQGAPRVESGFDAEPTFEIKDDSDGDEVQVDQLNPFDSVDMDEPVHPDAEDSITVGEVLVTMFDWVAAHKTTGAATEDVWKMLRAVCPPDESPGTYAIAERIMRHHLKDAVVRIPVCRFDCVAYFNFRSTAFKHLQYEDLQSCPVCLKSRYVTVNGKLVDAKVMYWFPSIRYWEFMFSDPELAMHLFNDLSSSASPVGSVRASYGFRRKVLDNPNISCDPRHQAIMLSTDGMPFFKDVQCRSGWPVLLRSAMLPDGLWNTSAYTHMLAFQASDYLDEDPETGKVNRIKRYHINVVH